MTHFYSRRGVAAKAFLFLVPVFCFAFSFSFRASRPESAKSSGLPKIDYIPFKPGEKLLYNLHYGMINAGEASLTVNEKESKIAGRNHYEIDVSGNSNSFFDPFYKVRDSYQSFIDEETMLPTVFARLVQEGSYKKTENYIFIRAKNEVVSGKRTYAVPEGIHDLVSTFYYLRCIDFSKQKPGAMFHITALFEDSLLYTGLKYTGKETIKTDFGNMRCYLFSPMLAKGRIFKNQEGMKLYVSEDRNQIPVRIESKVYLDYVRADLDKYQNLKYPMSSLVK